MPNSTQAPDESPIQPAPLSVIPNNVFQLEGVAVSYGDAPAVSNIDLAIRRGEVTALIGPSGCGKSTLLRCLNRMNDLIPSASVSGIVTYCGHDLYAHDVDPVAVRRHIGMVFQKPNPFPKSIYENVAFGLKVVGDTDNLDDRVEDALQKAALWDEVSNRLDDSALSLSGGQQQRLCIARAIATAPEAILMDEPCSALDPHATARIEELIDDLRGEYTIVIVTHNMAQARRVADQTAFFTTRANARGETCGELVEVGPTETLFTNPADSRTSDYVLGRFG